MTTVTRGRLHDSSSAPATGERVEELVRVDGLVIEQILGGVLDGPVDYLHDSNEWVVLIDGTATLDIDGQRLDLDRGDWVLLPGGVPHRVVSAEPRSNWLAVHLARG